MPCCEVLDFCELFCILESLHLYICSDLKTQEANTPCKVESQQAELFLASIGLQPSSSKEQKEAMSEPKSSDPSAQMLPPGWRKIYTKRMGGRSAGKYDAYIYSPDGRKHRSKTDLLAYLTKRGIADQYSMDSFDFTVRSVSVAESVDSLNSSTSTMAQTKEKKSSVNSSEEKLDVKKKKRKYKEEDGLDKSRVKKAKHSTLENSGSVSLSETSEGKKLKKFKKLAAALSEKSKRQSNSGFTKSKVSSPAKSLKHSVSLKLRRKLKIKMNFSPRVKRENEFSSSNTSEMAANELPCVDLTAKSSQSLDEDRLDDSRCRSFEESAEDRQLGGSSLFNVSCESIELFSDAEDSQIPMASSSLDCDEDRKSDHLKSLKIDSNTDIFTDEVVDAKEALDSPCDNHMTKRTSSFLEECNNNSSLLSADDRNSSLFCSPVKTETCQPHGINGSKQPFAVNNIATLDQEIHSSPKQVTPQKWNPPQSPFNLIEESLGGNPWKVLVTSIFMDSRESCLAESGLPKKTARLFFKLCPTPEDLQSLSTKKIFKTLKQDIISEETIVTIKKFSEEYLTTNWQDPTTLHGIMSYGKDSYRMFCVNEWKQIAPAHPKLKMYHKWLWQNHRALGID